MNWNLLMKIAVVIGLMATGFSTDGRPAAVSENARMILEYRTQHPGCRWSRDPVWIESVAESTERSAWLLGVGLDTQVLLTQWMVESDFDPAARTGACFGIPQVNQHDLPYYYDQLKKVMPSIPPLAGILKYPDCQIALGVMAFKCKLRDAHGNLWDAVRRYNGGGPAARRYQRDVKRLYRRIFKQLRHVGGTAAPRLGAKQGEHSMIKRIGLAVGLLLTGQLSHVALAEVAQPTTITATPAEKQTIFRDHGKDFARDEWKAVEAQKAAYLVARDKYKQTWVLADVKEASRLAFTSPVAAWPYYNYANHLIENDGDETEAGKALDQAETLMKGFDGPIVEEITGLIARRRKDLVGE